MTLVNVNYLAVFVSAVVSMVLGSFWYSSKLFGKKWMESIGKTSEELQSEKKGVWKSYVLTFIGAFVTAYVFALFLGGLGVANVAQGVEIGFWIWIGFVITTSLGGVVFEKRQPWLYVINNGYHLASFILTAIILVLWR